MKTTLFSFLLTFIFASCNSPKSYNSQPLSDRIIGDWIKEKPDTTFNKSILLSFEKSICFDFSNEFVNYKLVGNHLYIDELRKNTFRYLFRIENNKADELSLISINSHAKELSSILNHSDTLIFNRIPPAEYHPFFFDKIAFYSTGCFGLCPSMYFEMDSLGSFLFQAKSYTSIGPGFYRGQVPSEMLRTIKKKLHKLDIFQLRKNYVANWTDDQTCGIYISLGKSHVESHAYGFDREPTELRVLFSYLQQVYTSTQLTPDSTVSKSFKYADFIWNGVPLPPPPPPITKR